MYSERAIKIKEIYKNILEIFGSMKVYKSIPEYQDVLMGSNPTDIEGIRRDKHPWGLTKRLTTKTGDELFGMAADVGYSIFSLSSPKAVSTLKTNYREALIKALKNNFSYWH